MNHHIRRTTAAAVAIALWTGLACTHRYGPARHDYAWGYSETELGSRAWDLAYQGRFEDGREDVLRLWHKRAAQLCGGFGTFWVRDLRVEAQDAMYGTTYKARGGVRCKPDAAAPATTTND